MGRTNLAGLPNFATAEGRPAGRRYRKYLIKRTPGLQKRGNLWCIDKKIFGQRIRESTGINSLEEAEKYLAKRIENLRQVVTYGARPKRKFREAAAKFF
jgi:hypothetical protein